MKKLRVICLLCATALATASCITPSLIKESRPFPDIVRRFEHFTLYGDRPGMKDTGIYLEEGDLYTVMATGSVDMWPTIYGAPAGFQYHDVKPSHGWVVLARFGDNFSFRPFYYGISGTIDEAMESGTLHLGVRDGPMDLYGEPLKPEYYDRNGGFFSVYVIVWKSADYDRIADFMRKLAQRAPDNEGIADALRATERFERIYLAEKEAAEEIQKTKQELEDLKSIPEPEKVPPGASADTPEVAPPATETDAGDKVKALEAKLAMLAGTLKQLDKMKKELAEEREKSNQLAEELQEKELRQQELLTQIAQGAKSPPLLILASPAGETRTELAHVRLIGAAEDDKGVLSLVFTVNGVPLKKAPGRGVEIAQGAAATHVDFSERIALEKGKNVIAVKAFDRDGLSAERSVIVHRTEKQRTLWAVVVGINDYPNVRKLNFAVNDAKAFYELLVRQNGVPEENVFLLLNEKATLTAVRSALGTALKKKAGKEDMVIIYFAGHGASERDAASEDGDGLTKYLLPYDADMEDLYSTALPMREIAHIFNRIRSERLIFLVDACYSGASGGRTVSYAGLRANLSDKFLDRIAAGRGKVIISASGPNEVSAEDDEMRHGIFTYYLLEAMSGRADVDNDRQISVDEAYQYVSDNVARATGQEQHPVKKGVVEGQLILSVVE